MKRSYPTLLRNRITRMPSLPIKSLHINPINHFQLFPKNARIYHSIDCVVCPCAGFQDLEKILKRLKMPSIY